MRCHWSISLSCLLAFGCSKEPNVAVVQPIDYELEFGRTPANIALGPSAEHGDWAMGFGRADRPGVDIGYQFQQPSWSTEVIFDDQSFYDRLGGATINSRQSVRTEVWVR